MNYIGIDLGGTNIKGALVSAEGEILKEHSIPTRVDLGPEAVAGRIGQVIAQLSIGEDTVGGVGVGCPGTVDDASGIVRFAANLNFVNFDLRSALRAHTALPIHLGNDANAAALGEALEPSFKTYQQQVVKNARALAEGLVSRGFQLVSGGTDNHLMLVDLTNLGKTGKEAENLLDEVNITCNKNTIPNDPKSAFVTSGVRLGTAAVTSRGMNTEDMDVIAEAIAIVLKEEENAAKRAKALVKGLTEKYPLI